MGESIYADIRIRGKSRNSDMQNCRKAGQRVGVQFGSTMVNELSGLDHISHVPARLKSPRKFARLSRFSMNLEVVLPTAAFSLTVLFVAKT